MGAWALTLFSCDYDLNLILELNDQAGLRELAAAAGAKDKKDISGAAQRQADHERIRRGDDTEDTTTKAFPPAAHECDGEVKYSLYAKLCSDPRRVRAYIDSGPLRRMMDQYGRELLEANDYWKADAYGPGYQFVLLGCCAMTLGAQLGQKDRDLMQTHLRLVPLMRDAVKQVEAALDPDTGYVSGVPWDFMTKPFGTTINKEEDLVFPGTGTINCRAPDHGYNPTEMAAFRQMCMPALVRGGLPGKPMSPAQRAKTMANLDYDHFKTFAKEPAKSQEDAGFARYFADGMSGFCGSRKAREGGALLQCNKSKAKSYCGKDCQRMAWKQHKKVCRAPKA
ncbi:hypothetical protein TI39_contig4130g00003 [Zymoseptoria brevis]|uniref:MYND-type domain-containing protein n=1 Tax=Zymoseptoria brevis TaxID=1047168 RepID=A0A0F4GCU6_9PEZI|nr:hypothetical protein TI39_contig4130g00003 [Zymoseptoria brevis]